LTALKARSLALSRWASGYAFLEVWLHPANPHFSVLRHALSNPLNVPSTMRLRSSLHQNLFCARSLREKSAFKTHS
jgi:hypothetical protein